jgi:hypothetical protein
MCTAAESHKQNPFWSISAQGVHSQATPQTDMLTFSHTLPLAQSQLTARLQGKMPHDVQQMSAFIVAETSTHSTR